MEGATSTANIGVVDGQDFFNKDGVDYKLDISILDGDGVYVKYVAVPEPSTYAAIFGALALGFAIYRRRK